MDINTRGYNDLYSAYHKAYFDMKKLNKIASKSEILLSLNEACIWQYIFFYLGFSHGHSWITGLQGKGEGISLTPH